MHNISSPLILASQSPRRKELLSAEGYEFEVLVPSDDAESGEIPGESISEMVTRLARQKAANVASRIKQGIVIGCDTLAECRGKALGKPKDRNHAEQMLRWLRGERHLVHSGLCLWKRPEDAVRVAVVTTTLQMDPITDAQLKDYLDSGQWQGKAGAFGYQDGNDWLHVIEGSESNVVGLPLECFAELLAEIN